MSETRLIAYDISNNSRRTRLSKLLEKKGYRLQKSVFLVNLSRHQFKKLKKDIWKIAAPEGEVAIIPIAENCMNRAERLGPENPKFHIF